jgi:hypothetical protein
MASVAQLLANRSNAQKSTGPRTPEGKAAVAQNAVRHGLCAERVVIKGEDPGEFEMYRDRMLGDLDPVGPVEALLAERVFTLGWRLQRAQRFEGAAWAALEAKQAREAADRLSVALPRPKGDTQPEDEEQEILGRIVVKDFGDAKVLDQLLVYERRIENSLYRTLGELRKQQVLRALQAEEAPRSEYRLQAGEESPSPNTTAPVGAGPRACPKNAGQPQEERGRPRGAAPTKMPERALGRLCVCPDVPGDASCSEAAAEVLSEAL